MAALIARCLNLRISLFIPYRYLYYIYISCPDEEEGEEEEGEEGEDEEEEGEEEEEEEPVKPAKVGRSPQSHCSAWSFVAPQDDVAPH